jgi:hypothetical protein
MRKSFAILIRILCVFFATLLIIFCWALWFSKSFDSTSMLIVGSRKISLEVVQSPIAMAKGLSGRSALPNDSGMLFVFPTPDIYPFWMKDMQFPIDIIWILDGVIVDSTTLQPPKQNEDIPKHEPTALADQVLELNAGEAKKLGLAIGSRVEIRRE